MNLTTKLSRPWAITPAGFADARGALVAFLTMDDFIVPRQDAGMGEDGVAHIHVKGALGDDMPPIWGKVGNTDYRKLRSECAAVADLGAERCIVHIDSPGGMCAGLPEATEAIARVAGAMPTEAHVEGMACSAGYHLACACDKILASPSSDVGNIGTVMAWADATDFFADQGITFNVLTNEGADLKGAFHNAGSLTEAQAEFLQDRVNQLGAEFRAVVEGSRENIDPEVFRAGWYSGQQAIDLGLIDGLI